MIFLSLGLSISDTIKSFSAINSESILIIPLKEAAALPFQDHSRIQNEILLYDDSHLGLYH